MIDLEELEEQALALGVLELLKQRLVRYVPIPNPAVGAELAFATPASTWWELLGIRFTFRTSAVVANRIPQITVQDAALNYMARFPHTASLAAGTANFFSFWQGYGDHVNNASVVESLPSPAIQLQPGFIIGTLTTNLDAGDDYDTIFACVREWRPDLVQANLDWIIGTMR